MVVNKSEKSILQEFQSFSFETRCWNSKKLLYISVITISDGSTWEDVLSSLFFIEEVARWGRGGTERIFFGIFKEGSTPSLRAFRVESME